MTDTSEAAMARRAAEQLSGATAAMVTQVGVGRAHLFSNVCFEHIGAYLFGNVAMQCS